MWTGATSTTWSTASNWNANATPGASNDAKIPQSGITNFPVLSANASVNSFEIVSGADVNASAYTLSVNGNLINNGSITGDDGSGKLSMSGSASQTITGVGSIDNLEINNSNGVSITSSNTVTINEGFYPVSGLLTTNGGLILNSDANGTASIFQKSSSCTTYISGDVVLKRYIDPNGNNSYRFIGNPFNDGTKLYSSFTNLPLSYAYHYNTSYASPNPTNSTGDPAWSRITGTDTFEQYRGIISYLNSTTSSFTIQATGPLNQCDVVVSVSSYSNNDANKGYVLLSNPYAAFLDLSSNTTRTNVQNGFYVWDTATTNTDADSQNSVQSLYNAKGKYKSIVPGAPVDATLVPPMGAFLVKLSAGEGLQSGSITFKETEKSNSRSVLYYTPFALQPKPGLVNSSPVKNRSLAPSNIPFYFLKLQQNGQVIDDFKLVFRAEASNDYDNWDLTKMPNSNLDLYAKLPNSAYNFAVDTRSLEFDNFEIPIFVTSKVDINAENFELKWEHFNEVDADFILEDLQTFEKIKLVNGKAYTFKGGSKNPESPRFNLNVIKKGSDDEENVIVYPNPANKYINIQGNDVLKGEYIISIFDANGNKVQENSKTFSLNVAPSIITENLNPGLYFIQIKNANGFFLTKKLLIK